MLSIKKYKVFYFLFLIIGLQAVTFNSSLTFLPAGKSVVGMSWQPASAHDGYAVYRQNGGIGVYSKITNLEPEKTFFADTTVSPGVAYSYYVLATNSITSISSSTNGIMPSAYSDYNYFNTNLLLKYSFDSKRAVKETGIYNPTLPFSPKDGNFLPITPLTDGYSFSTNANASSANVRFFSANTILNKSNITVAFYIRHDTYVTTVPVYGFLYLNCWSNANNKMGLFLQNDMKIGFELANGASELYLLKSATPIQLSNWYHIAMTIENSKTMSLYVNGILQQRTNIISPALLAKNRFEIMEARYVNPNTTQTKFYFDDYRIYNRGLSQNEIIKLIDDGTNRTQREIQIINTFGNDCYQGASYSNLYTFVRSATPTNIVLNITNKSTTDSLSVTGITISGSPTFLTTGGTSFPLSVNAGQNVPVSLALNRGTAGTGLSQITVLNNDVNEPSLTFSLQIKVTNYLTFNSIPVYTTPGKSIIHFNWQAASGHDGYAIYRGAAISGPFTKIGSVAGNRNDYADTSLSPNTTYYYYVVATNSSASRSSQTNGATTDSYTDYNYFNTNLNLKLSFDSKKFTTDAGIYNVSLNNIPISMTNFVPDTPLTDGYSFSASVTAETVNMKSFVSSSGLDKSNFTISFFVKHDTYETADPTFGFLYYNAYVSTYNKLWLVLKTDQKVRVDLANGDSGKQYWLESSSPIQLSNWYHIAMSIDNGHTLSLYINGNLEGSTTINEALLPSPSMFEAMSLKYVNNVIKTQSKYYFDDFRIYNRALSGGEIVALIDESTNKSKREIGVTDSFSKDYYQGVTHTNAFTFSTTSVSTNIVLNIQNKSIVDPLQISGITVSGVSPAIFNIASPATPFSISAGQTTPVTFTLNRETAGTFWPQITINNNDVNESPLNFSFGINVLTGSTISFNTTPNFTAIGKSLVRVKWSAATGHNGYGIYRAANAGGPFTKIGTSASNVTYYADTTVSPNSQYYYYVVATNYVSSVASQTNLVSTDSYTDYNYFQSNLLLKLSFDGKKAVKDTGIYNYTLNVAPTIENFSPLTPLVDGYSFGINAIASTADHRFFRANNTTLEKSNITVSFFVRHDTYESTVPTFGFVYLNSYSNTSTKMWLVLNANRTVGFELYNSGTFKCTSTTTIQLSNWYHIAMTIENWKTMSLYINGNLEASTVINQPHIRSANYFEIMAAKNSSPTVFTESQYYFDDFRIYNTGLSQTEIVRLIDQSTNQNYREIRLTDSLGREGYQGGSLPVQHILFSEASTNIILKITNLGKVDPLTISQITLDGTDVSKFSLQTPFTGSIVGSSSLNLNLSFLPDSMGSNIVRLNILNDDIDEPELKIILPVLVKTSDDSTITIYRNSTSLAHKSIINLGTIYSNQTTNIVFTISNAGTSTDLRITDYQLTGYDFSAFNFLNTIPTTLVPSEQTTLNVQFASDIDGTFSSVLQFTSSDQFKPQFDITISGTRELYKKPSIPILSSYYTFDDGTAKDTVGNYDGITTENWKTSAQTPSGFGKAAALDLRVDREVAAELPLKFGTEGTFSLWINCTNLLRATDNDKWMMAIISDWGSSVFRIGQVSDKIEL